MNLTPPDIEGAPDSPPETANPGSPPRPSPTFGMFADDEGLRPVWGILLFLFLWYFLRYFMFPLCEALFRSHSFDTASIAPHDEYSYEGAAFLCAAIPTWLMTRVERRRLADYGFAAQRSLRNFTAGIFWGVALLSSLVLILWLTGFLVFDARLLFGRSVLSYGVVWLGGFLLVALAEETFLRGYLQFTLSRGLSQIYQRFLEPSRANILGFWTAATVLSFVFGLGHVANSGESPLGLLSAGLIGLVFCLSLWRTGSLCCAIGFHTAWDWAQSFLYGVPDSGLMVKGHLFATHPAGPAYLSGGPTGPEASVFLLPVIAATVAVVVFTLPSVRNGYAARHAPTLTALDLP
jgi:membrane protease YdiL (CAAX protease family)